MPWDRQLVDSEILAVHAAVQNFDQLIFFGGNQHDPVLAVAGQVDATRLFDTANGAVKKISSPAFDAFCAGHALTVHGTLMVAGGTDAFNLTVAGLHHEHFPGLRDSSIFRNEAAALKWHPTALLNPGENAPVCAPGQDPVTNRCTTAENYGRNGGRWYPTLVTLPNGDLLALSGHPGAGDREHVNYIPEVFTPSPVPNGQWHRLGSYSNPAEDQLFETNRTGPLGWYPRAHLLPTGDVLLVTPTQEAKTVTLTVGQNPWSGTFHPICECTPAVAAGFDQYAGIDQTSVLLPLRHDDGYRPRVLACNGTDAWVLDLGDWKPGTTPENALTWSKTAPRELAGSPLRKHGHAVLLPTGEVLVVGGVVGIDDSTAVQTPEIYDPETNRWSALEDDSETAAVVRNYHSVALLMRDGRVWTAGSDRDAGRGTGVGGAAELRIEIYEPWYVREANRPDIISAPDRWRTGSRYPVLTTQAKDIVRVAMVRCGSCTHAFNSDQRYISLAFDYQTGDLLTVDAPPNGNISPSGMYFLYTINRQGLPSKGIALYVSTDPTSEPERQWEDLYRSEAG